MTDDAALRDTAEQNDNITVFAPMDLVEKLEGQEKEMLMDKIVVAADAGAENKAGALCQLVFIFVVKKKRRSMDQA